MWRPANGVNNGLYFGVLSGGHWVGTMTAREHLKGLFGEVELLKRGVRNKRLPEETRVLAATALTEIVFILGGMVQEIGQTLGEGFPEMDGDLQAEYKRAATFLARP